VLSKNTVAMHWQRHKVGAAHWREMAERGEKMEVVIAVGADPASLYSASAPLPPTVDEFIFAGFLRKAPVHLAKAVTCDLEVPADAEFVIEGYIDPREALVTEGPFGDHTGFYSEADLYPLVHVTAVTMRKKPVYVTTIVGRPPMEDFTSATPPNGSSFRCFSSRRRKSWTITCRPRGFFTTSSSCRSRRNSPATHSRS